MSANGKPREWEILKCSNNGDEFIRGPDTQDNEFVKVREVTEPSDVSNEEIYAAFQRDYERPHENWEEAAFIRGARWAIAKMKGEK